MNIKTASAVRPVRFRAEAAVFLLSVVLVFGTPTVQAQSIKRCDQTSFEHIRDGLIAPIMAALKLGDLSSLQSHLSPEMNARYHRLLTENATYASYLRSYFQDSGYLLRDVVTSPNGYTAIIEVYWANGNREVYELDLGNDDPHLPATGVTRDCGTP